MRFTTLDKKELRDFFKNKYKRILERILDYVIDNFPKDEIKKCNLPEFMFNKTKRYQATKRKLLDVTVELFDNHDFIMLFYKVLSKNETYSSIYYNMIWEKSRFNTTDFELKFNLKLKSKNIQNYGYDNFNLDNELSFISRNIRYSYSGVESDIIYIENNLRDVLKFVYPIPIEYNLIPRTKTVDTEFTYNNEQEVLPFIETIGEMLENNLVEFGKTNEKPLVKSLNILKQSTSLNEFYPQKKMNSFVVDMLTRSIYYYKERFNFKTQEYNTLKRFIEYQFKDKFNFTISRIFTSHLKKVRFGRYANEQEELFGLVRYIIDNMPKESWVGVDNIIKFCYYRDLSFRFEDNYKTQYYEFNTDKKTLYVGDYYQELFFEPVLKGVFFYLGALGLIELKYNTPISNYPRIKAKKEDYISVWDGLKYIRFTELGKYVFGFSKTYKPLLTAPKKKVSKLKFDEFKPIITVDTLDAITIAKLEPFTDKLDNNRYILSYTKFFKDSKNLKTLKLKIDGFYKKIEPNPPKVFIEFLENMIKESNLLKRNLKQIVIELEDNKRLLNLFMTNQKLQKLFIKAEGYRIIVLKDDISKVTKIVEDNGFFVEF